MRGGLSLGARQLFAAGVGIGAGIVLARTLEPAVFGIYAVITFVGRFFTQFSDVGVGAAVIRKSRMDPEDLATAFVMQQLLTLLAIAGVWITAGLWASAYDLPQAPPMMRTLAVAFWIASLGTIPSLVLERTMRFEALALADLTSTVTYHVLAVALALGGFGVWSFIVAALARSTVDAVILNAISPWRPRLAFSSARAREIVSFGLPFQLNKLVGLAANNITATLVGLLSGVAAVGYLNWAQGLAYLPLTIMPLLGRVTFPAYSRLQADPASLRRALEKTFALLALGLYPLTFLLLALAPEIVEIVYTEKWLPALPSVYLFSVAAIWAVVSFPITNALLALGRAATVLKLSAVWTVTAWILSVPLVFLLGSIGYAVAMALVSQMAILAVWELRKVVEVRILRWIVTPLLASAAMGAAVRFVAAGRVNGVVDLVAFAVAGLALYGAILIVFGGAALAGELRSVLRVLPAGARLERLWAGFERLSRRWRTAIHQRFYHDREREALIRDMVSSVAPGRSLEIGCGPGRLPRVDAPGVLVLADRELPIVRRLARAWKDTARPYHFLVSDAASLPFRGDAFDHIAVLDVLEHVPEQRRAAREIERVLAPGGSITFFGPAENWRFPYHRWLRPVALPEQEVLEVWGHVHRGYSPGDVRDLFPDCGERQLVRYHEGPLAFRVDVEYSRLPFPIKVTLWAIGEIYYRLLAPLRSPGDPICFGMRLCKPPASCAGRAAAVTARPGFAP